MVHILNKTDEKLSMEEYANFLFSHSENLDVDLKALKPATADQFPASTGSMRSQAISLIKI